MKIKYEYKQPAVRILLMQPFMEPGMNFATGEINGDEEGGALSKMTPFMEPEERGDIADEYFEHSSAPQVDFGNIWADE